jgi:hypothetical protein
MGRADNPGAGGGTPATRAQPTLPIPWLVTTKALTGRIQLCCPARRGGAGAQRSVMELRRYRDGGTCRAVRNRSPGGRPALEAPVLAPGAYDGVHGWAGFAYGGLPGRLGEVVAAARHNAYLSGPGFGPVPKRAASAHVRGSDGVRPPTRRPRDPRADDVPRSRVLAVGVPGAAVAALGAMCAVDVDDVTRSVAEFMIQMPRHPGPASKNSRASPCSSRVTRCWPARCGAGSPSSRRTRCWYGGPEPRGRGRAVPR